jgi:hypothetical protein
VEDAVEHLFFVLFEHSGLLAGGDQHLQLFFRMYVSMAARRLHAEHLDDGPAHPVQGADERVEEAKKEFRRLGHDERGLLRVLQGDGFRRELAEDDVKGRDDDEGDVRRWYATAADRGVGSLAAPAREAGNGRLADHPRPRLAVVMPSWVAAMN